jgi:crotonobetainyl-CoA:carnitine CoA-transferase CaiB-like acyl-CoA transferase
MVVEMEHPTIENLRLTGSPLNFSKTPVTMRKHPPLYGEHTKEILEKIGYSPAEIRHFKQNNVI